MPTLYNPKVLQKYADELYSKADLIVLATAAKYGFLAFVTTFVLCVLVSTLDSADRLFASLAVAVLGVIFGVITGQAKAFQFRLEAQRTLCQVQMEANTRPREEGGATPRLQSAGETELPCPNCKSSGATEIYERSREGEGWICRACNYTWLVARG